MAYNENDLNPTKGTIGEFLYANYLDYSSGGKTRCINPDLQQYGIDWRIEAGTHRIDIDVKLSDLQGEYFAVTFRNGNNIRMPYKKGCEATWLGIVTFDWARFVREEAKDLNELEFAHQAREKLRVEYVDRNYVYTKKVIKNYCSSIVDVKVQTIQQLCKGFAEKEDGDGNFENGEVVAIRKGSDHYAAAHIKWSAIRPQSRRVHYESKKVEHVATTPYALTYKWEFRKNSRIIIDEYDKTLEEMNKESLEWIRDQNKSLKSTFWKKYHLRSQQDFDKLLSKIIKEKTKQQSMSQTDIP